MGHVNINQTIAMILINFVM